MLRSPADKLSVSFWLLPAFEQALTAEEGTPPARRTGWRVGAIAGIIVTEATKETHAGTFTFAPVKAKAYAPVIRRSCSGAFAERTVAGCNTLFLLHI